MGNKKHRIFDNELLGDFFRSKLNVGILISTTVVLLTIYIYFLSIKDLILFPNNKEFSFVGYTDKNNGGNSEIAKLTITDHCVEIQYDLKKGFISPYIGLGIGRKDKGLFNLSLYNQLQIDVEGSGMKSLNFSLFIQSNDQKYPATKNQIIFAEKFNISSKHKSYILEFDKLNIPDWWFSINDISPNEKISPPLKTVQSCNIGTEYDPQLGVIRTLKIHSITFNRNNTLLLINLITFELIVLLLLVCIHLLRAYIKIKSNAVVISYKAIDVKTENNQLTTFIDFINNHFHDCELSLEQVSSET